MSPERTSVDRASCNIALLIIDMQNDFVSEKGVLKVDMAYQTIPVISRLLEFARTHGWMVVHVVRQHDPSGKDADMPRKHLFNDGAGGFCVKGSWGAEIVESLKPQPGEYIHVKHRNSAFLRTDLEDVLRQSGINTVIVSGTQYPNCIRATANDAMSLDFRTIVATDACSAKTREIADANINDLKNMGIECMNVESIIKSFE